jgi:ubiquinone biosynthesis protein COQ4
MPEGSLGRAIAEWYAREEISAEGLADASQAAFSEGGAGTPVASEDQRLFSARLRELHDVFHVLTGYDRDVRGELAVLAFTLPQTRNPGIGYIVLSILRQAGWRSEMGKLIRQGFRRGRRAQWLIAQDWEALFEQPLDQVREKLDVGTPPDYRQVRSAGAPALSG